MTIKQLKRQHSHDTRSHVVAELYDTERSYVESLQVLTEKYMKPLKATENGRTIIDPNLVDEIFHSIPEMLAHHENFLAALQATLSSDWDSSRVIGNVLIEAFTNQQVIDTYTNFINNWRNARHAIKSASQARPHFERFLETVSREHRNKLTLDALLIMPVQRIPRYELLIRELIKYTPAGHPDHEPLIKAQREIHELALKIDRAEREMMHLERLRDLESLIEGHAELQHNLQREFLRYDLVTICASTFTTTRKERVLFLLSDLLLMASIKKKVSRRANLQAALASSSSDLSLLEGNKFKLISRLALDQVEILSASKAPPDGAGAQPRGPRHCAAHYELHTQGHDSEERHARELERDLYAAQQMQILAGQISLQSAVRARLIEDLNLLRQDISSALARNFAPHDLDLLDAAARQPQQVCAQPAHPHDWAGAHEHGSQLATAAELLVPLESAQETLREQQQQQQHPQLDLQVPLTSAEELASSGASASVSPGVQGEEFASKSAPDGTLEFVIKSGHAPAQWDAQSSAFAPVASEPARQAQDALGASAQHAADQEQPEGQAAADHLAVTFASHERRQAFVQAFREAKSRIRRAKQQQQPPPQQLQKAFAPSLSLRLARPGFQSLMKSRSIASDPRRNPLRHQDEFQEPARQAAPVRPQASAPPAANSEGGAVPQACAADKTWSSPLPALGTSSHIQQQQQQQQQQQVAARWCACSSTSSPQDNNHQHHHHHHQLMHQPASHPALLYTICCHDAHARSSERPSTRSLEDCVGYERSHSDSGLAVPGGRPTFVCGAPAAGREERPAVVVSSCARLGLAECNELNAETPAPKPPVARLLTVLPLASFLHTQHPALQLTSSVSSSIDGDGAARSIPSWPSGRSGELRRSCDSSQTSDAFGAPSKLQPLQSVRDDRAQLWLCMSNGYVSHVARVRFERRAQLERNWREPPPAPSVEPLVRSSGDLCRARINCATQVLGRGPARPPESRGTSTECARDTGGERAPATAAANLEGQLPEVLIKSASPPAGPDLSPRHGDSLLGARQISCPSTPGPRRVSASFTQLSSDVNKQRAGAIKAHCARASSEGLPGAAACPCGSAGWPQQPQQHKSRNHCQAYRARHSTVPLADLRRTLERESLRAVTKKSERALSPAAYRLAPPVNSPRDAARGSPEEPSAAAAVAATTTTKPAGRAAGGSLKSLGSAKLLLRRQASLKTSAILAKLVSSAGRGSFYRRKSSGQSCKGRAAGDSQDEKELKDRDALEGPRDVQQQQQQKLEISSNSSIVDINPAMPAPGALHDQQRSLVSPLSSVSSLNSLAVTTNSSLTVNSGCASSSSRSGSCAQLPQRPHWASTACCSAAATLAVPCERSWRSRGGDGGPRWSLSGRAGKQRGPFRSRSATVPCRWHWQQAGAWSARIGADARSSSRDAAGRGPNELAPSCERTAATYRVSGLADDCWATAGEAAHEPPSWARESRSLDDKSAEGAPTSLWLGCDDGTLVIVDCLSSSSDPTGPGAWAESQESSSSGGGGGGHCHNAHWELKLGAPVTDIKNHQDRTVFVALGDGRLVAFRRAARRGSQATEAAGEWQLEEPQIVALDTVAAAPAESRHATCCLCLVGEDQLWCSRGREILILDTASLDLLATIEASQAASERALSADGSDRPAGAISAMEGAERLDGVWLAFAASPLLQLYGARSRKLVLETSLLEPVSRVLARGDPILQHHKLTRGLELSSLLSAYDELAHTSALFVGTSAGVILCVALSRAQLDQQIARGAPAPWSPQVVSLRHGHTGPVRLLRLLELATDACSPEPARSWCCDREGARANSRARLCLVSGGPGLELFGPEAGPEVEPSRETGDNDCLSHLILWQLYSD